MNDHHEPQIAMLGTSESSSLKIDGVPHAVPELAELQRRAERAAAVVPQPAPGVGGAVARGSMWTIAGYGGSQLIRLAGNIVVSRLVMPEAFGVMALVNVFVQALTMFSDVGVEPAIVQSRRGDEPIFFNTAWTVQVVRGWLLAAAAFAVGALAAAVYDEPRLAYLIPAAAAGTALSAFNSTALFAARRQLQLGRLTLLDLAAQATGVGAMCAAAWHRADAWAMIVGAIASSTVTLVGSHFLLPGYRNRFAWERSAFDEIFRFGKWILVSTIITFFALQIDRVLLGRLIPRDLLGVYSVAAAIALLPNMVLQALAGAVLYPLLARSARRSREHLNRNVDTAREVLLAAGLFGIVGVQLEADTFFALLYDQRYAAAGDIARLISWGVWAVMLSTTLERVPQALGDTRSLASYNFAKVSAAVLAAPAGFYFGGLPGFLVGYAFAMVIGHVVLAAVAEGHGVSVWRNDLRMTALVLLASILGISLAQTFDQWHGPVVREIAVWTYLAGLGSWAVARTMRLRQIAD